MRIVDRIPFPKKSVKRMYGRLLCGGIWCIIQLEYISENKMEEDAFSGIVDIDGNPVHSKKKSKEPASPIKIVKLTPIPVPHVDIEELKSARKQFSKQEWVDIMLRSIGMEPDTQLIEDTYKYEVLTKSKDWTE